MIKSNFLTQFPKENFKTPEEVLKIVNLWLIQVRGHETQQLQSYRDLFIEITATDQLKGTCTDERDIVNKSQNDKYLRFVGGASGLIHAIEAVKGQVNLTIRKQIINIAEQHNIHLINHRDNVHGSEGNPVGCGYLGLLAMEEAETVFGFSLSSSNNQVSEYVKKMERDLGISTIELDGEHVAQNGGLLINLEIDKALNPEGKAKNSFFSLDLGLLNSKLKEMGSELGLNEDEQQQVLINITRDNMAACFVLSNGNINGTKFIVTGKADSQMKTVIEKAYGELTESKRMEAMNVMIEKRKHGH